MIFKTLVFCSIAVAPVALAQAAQPAKSVQQTREKSCLIVKHKGTISRRVIFAVLTGVPIAPGAKYDLVDSLGYRGAKLSYSGKELGKIQETGTRIVVLSTKPVPEDVQTARAACFVSPTNSK